MLNPSVQVSQQDGVLVAEFWDCLRLDPAPVRSLHTKFAEHLAKGGNADLIIDLLGIAFAGSAAIGGFVSLQRVARAKGGRMIFCNVDATVFEVFRASRLDVLYTFTSDRASALKSLEQSSPNSSIEPTPLDEPSLSAQKNPATQPSGSSRLRRRPRGD